MSRSFSCLICFIIPHIIFTLISYFWALRANTVETKEGHFHFITVCMCLRCVLPVGLCSQLDWDLLFCVLECCVSLCCCSLVLRHHHYADKPYRPVCVCFKLTPTCVCFQMLAYVVLTCCGQEVACVVPFATGTVFALCVCVWVALRTCPILFPQL